MGVVDGVVHCLHRPLSVFWHSVSWYQAIPRRQSLNGVEERTDNNYIQLKELFVDRTV